MSDENRSVKPPLPLALLDRWRLPSEHESHELEATRRATRAGQRARSIRTAQGRTLTEVGTLLGVTPQQLGRLETGARRLYPEMVARIAEVLGVPPEVLAGAPEEDATSAVVRSLPAPAAAIADALESIGYEVQSGDAAQGSMASSVRPDLVARHSLGPFLEHRLILLCRPQLLERDVITLSGLRAGLQPPHDPIIVVDREPDPRAVAEAARLGITVAVTHKLTALLIDLSGHARAAIERFRLVRPWFVMPLARVKGEKVTQKLDEVVSSWLADTATRNMLLLGEPGGGKSICCDWIAAFLADMHLLDPARSPVPVVVRLGQLPYVRDFYEIIVREIERTERPKPSNIQAVRHMTARGRFVILLDGFDEMNVRAGQNLLEDNLRAVRELLRSGSRVILTSRPAALGEQLSLLRQLDQEADGLVSFRRDGGRPPMQVVRIEDFNDRQIREMLHLVGSGDRAQLYEAISNSPVRDLARRPLILSLLCTNHEIMARLGSRSEVGLAAVLREHIELIIRHEHLRGASVAETLDVVSELAVEMVGGNLSSIHVKRLPFELRRIVGGSTGTCGVDQDLHRRVRSTFFLTVDDAGLVSFTHRLFLDYFVAWRICNDIVANRPERVRRLWIDSSVSPVLGELLREQPLPQCLRDWLDPHVHDEEVRAIAAFLIGVAGLVELIPDLRTTFASDPKFGVRSSAAYSLALLGDHEVLSQLVSRAGGGLPTVERTAARVQLLTLAHMDYPGTGPRPALLKALANARAWDVAEVVDEALSVASDPLNGESSRGAALTVLGQLADPEHYLPQLEALKQREGQRLQMALNRAIAAMRRRMKE